MTVGDILNATPEVQLQWCVAAIQSLNDTVAALSHDLRETRRGLYMAGWRPEDRAPQCAQCGVRIGTDACRIPEHPTWHARLCPQCAGAP